MRRALIEGFRTLLTDEAKAKKLAVDPADAKHGTLAGYNNHKCRCAPCKAARAAWHKAHYVPRPRKPRSTTPSTPTQTNTHNPET